MNELDRICLPMDTGVFSPEVDRVLLHHPQFLAADARDFMRLARHSAGRGEVEHSLHWYRKALRFWHHANQKSEGRWQTEQLEANREYAAAILGRGETSGRPTPQRPATAEHRRPSTGETEE